MAVRAALTLISALCALAAAHVHPPPAPGLHRWQQQTPITCPIIFDGRITKNTTLQNFDTDGLTPYMARYVHGVNITWSQILQFPDVPLSKFDGWNDKAVESTISDQSLFKPGAGNVQTGFRRAGFLFSGNNGTDASNVGVKTFHWSVRQDPELPLNLTHEYMNVWHETNAYDHNQFSFKAGIILFLNYTTAKDTWKITDYKDNIIWSTPIVYSDWQNFAITLDYDNSTLQIWYSQGNDPLVSGGVFPNDNSGGGQFQIGIAKKPTETTGVVYDGYQESGIHEGQIYGGIFVEDSADGCVSGSTA